MGQGSRQRRGRGRNGFEQFEPRVLLSGNGVIDLTPGLPDLQVVIAPTFKAPASTMSGTAAVINLPIQISNLNETTVDGKTVAVPAGLAMDVVVTARPGAGPDDGSADIQVGSLTGVAVGGLKVGGKLSMTVPVTLPEAVGGGDWLLVVTIDSGNAVAELGEDPTGAVVQANNVAKTPAFPVIQGGPDLTIAVVSAGGLPAAATAETGKLYTIPLRITNNGTLPVPANTTTTVQASLASELSGKSHNFDGTISVNIGGLAPHASVTASAVVFFTNDVNNSPSLLPDTQVFTFTVDPGNALPELNEGNNTATSKAVSVTPGLPALLLTPPANLKLPSGPVLGGGGQAIKATVKVTNLGNVGWSTTTALPYTVTLVAVPAGIDPSVDASGDLTMNAAAALDLPPIGVGKSANDTMSGTMPINAPAGQYQLYVMAQFPDVNGTQQTQYTLLAEQPITVTTGFVNLVVAIDPSAKLPRTTTSGNGSVFSLPLDVTNLGNLPTGKTAAVGVELTLSLPGDADFTPVTVGTTDDIPLEIGAIAPGATRHLSVSYFFNAGVGIDAAQAGQYVLTATLEDTAQIGELQTDDNTSAPSKPLGLILGDPDLTLSLPANFKPPAAVLAGSGKTFNLPLTIKNIGNVATPAGAATTVDVYAQDGSGDAPVLVAEVDGLDVAALAPGGTQPLPVTVTLTSSLPSGTYTLSAVIDPANTVEELNDDNNTVVASGKTVVTQGLVDFAASIDGTALQGKAVRSGDGSVISLPLTITNVGNLAVVKGQLIDVKITAVSTADGSVTTVGTVTGLNVGGMGVSAQKKFTLKTTLPIALLDGSYQLDAEVDSGQAVLEAGDTAGANGANNTAAGPTVNVTRVGPNLTVGFGPTLNLPVTAVSGDGTVIALPVVITNEGSLGVARGTKIDVLIQLHNQADGDDTSNDITLVEVDDLSVGGLAPGSEHDLNVNVTLPAGAGPGEFVIVATVDSNNQLPELNELDNAGATGPMTLTVV